MPYLCVCICAYVCNYPTPPSQVGCDTKSAKYKLVLIQSFPFAIPIALSRLKNPIFSNIYGEEWIYAFPQGRYRKEKHKLLHLLSEMESVIWVPKTQITDSISDKNAW